MGWTEASSATQALRAGAQRSSWLVSPRSASWKREWGCLLARLPRLAGWRGKHNQESEVAVSVSNITDYLRVWDLPWDLEIIVILPYLRVAKAWPCYVLRRVNKWIKKSPCFLGCTLCFAGMVVAASPFCASRECAKSRCYPFLSSLMHS